MNKTPQSCRGYSLIELMISMAILVIATAVAVTGWQYIVRGERLNSIQNELDIDVRNTMERIRRDLRLSSMDHIFVYPQGVGTNTAISFPKARPDPNTGLITLNTNTGLIVWDQTLVYHVWVSTPNELRLTTFDPRDNSLDDAQRQSQLESVVQYGDGSQTYNSQNATTRALFKNLFTWEIRGRGAQFDGYNPTITRMRNVMFGTALLGPGSHSFQFKVLGQNAASSGYKIGLDTLVASPSGLEREAEDQLVSAQNGGMTFTEYMAQGAWSGNNQLAFGGGGPGAGFTLSMENDRWEETNFRGLGSLCEDTEVQFNEFLNPKDFVLTLHGLTNAWFASVQTRDTVRNSPADEMISCAIRVPVRGVQMYDGGAIEKSGPLEGVVFRAGSAGNGFRIRAAYIAEAASPTNYSPDALNGGTQLFFPGGATDVNIPSSGVATGKPAVVFPISREKTYLVSYLMTSWPNWANPAYWTEMTPPNSNGTPRGSYVIPASAAPDFAQTQFAVWSPNPNVVPDPRLHGVECLRVYAPPKGTFTSQIIDTGQDAPQYLDLSWNAVKPAGTDVKFKVRTGNQSDLSDAAPWTNVVAIMAPSAVAPGSKRFAEVQCELYSDNTGIQVPYVKDFKLRWTGITRLTDVGGTITVGPDYGTFEVTVNNKPLIKGITIDLTIYEDVAGFSGVGSNRLTSTLTAEVEPRNTGK